MKRWHIQVKRISWTNSLENSIKALKVKRRISKDLEEDAYCFNSRGGEWWSAFLKYMYHNFLDPGCEE